MNWSALAKSVSIVGAVLGSIIILSFGGPLVTKIFGYTAMGLVTIIAIAYIYIVIDDNENS